MVVYNVLYILHVHVHHLGGREGWRYSWELEHMVLGILFLAERTVRCSPSLCMARETALAALISLETCSSHPDDSSRPNQLEL